MKKLSTPHKKYTFNSVIQYSRHFIQTDAFHSIYTTEIIIEKIVGSTNICQAAGVDDFARCFLKDSLRILLKHIRDLCNISMKLGRFSDSCKIAKLKPLFKKGLKTNFSNYRPILLLPLISKIIGKLIDEQRSSFLSNSSEILYNYQSAFRKIHSTDSFLCFFMIKFWRVYRKIWVLLVSQIMLLVVSNYIFKIDSLE